MADDHAEETKAKSTNFRGIVVSGLLGVIALGYLGAVVTGVVSQGERLQPLELSVFLVVALVVLLVSFPHFADRLESVKVAKLFEFELAQVRMQQTENKIQLDSITFIVPLLIPEAKRRHLINLLDKKTAYQGSKLLRTELRDMRAAQLIRSHTGKTVHEISDDRDVDLSDYVELTDVGTFWAKESQQLEQKMAELAHA
jgi:hypothetical protein